MTVRMPTRADALLDVAPVRRVCLENLHAMAALQDAIALIDALIGRLQTEPLANGTAAHASAAGPLPPVLAKLSTAEQPRSTAATAAGGAVPEAAALPSAASPAAAQAADTHSTTDGVAHQRPPQTAAGSAASAAAAGPAAEGDQSAREGRPSAKKVKAAKAPKPPPQEPTPADIFAKAHIQVNGHDRA